MRKLYSNTEAVLNGVQITALRVGACIEPGQQLRLAQQAVARSVSTLRLRSRSDRPEGRVRKAH